MSCHCLNRKIKCLAKANRIQDKQIKQLMADVELGSKVNIGQSVALGALASDKTHLTLTVSVENFVPTIISKVGTSEINAMITTTRDGFNNLIYNLIVTSDNMTRYCLDIDNIPYCNGESKENIVIEIFNTSTNEQIGTIANDRRRGFGRITIEPFTSITLISFALIIDGIDIFPAPNFSFSIHFVEGACPTETCPSTF